MFIFSFLIISCYIIDSQNKSIDPEWLVYSSCLNIIKLPNKSLLWITKKGLKVGLAYIIDDLTDPELRLNTKY